MIRIALLISLFLIFCPSIRSQSSFKTTDLLQRNSGNSIGTLTINQDSRIDTLLSRYILNNSRVRTSDGTQGIWGFRIQIYYNNIRSAREEAAKTQARFLSKFPGIPSYLQSQAPGYFIVRVGDYRTKADGYRDLLMVRKEFPDAYHVPDKINFPDVKKN